MRYDAYGLFAEGTHAPQIEPVGRAEAHERKDSEVDNRSFFQKTKDAFLSGRKDPTEYMVREYELRKCCIDTQQADFTNSKQKHSIESKRVYEGWYGACENTGAFSEYYVIGPAKSIFSLGWHFVKSCARNAISRQVETVTTRAATGESGPVTVVESVETSVGQTTKEIGYVPICPKTGEKLPLPRNQNGVNLPSSLDPHTQIGWAFGRKGGYKQTRQWGKDGKLIKTTDWTDHGRPLQHPNPHDHLHTTNPTGGIEKYGDPIPFRIIITE